MVGQPGAGKTTTAHALQSLTGAEHLWADHVRKEQFTAPTYSHQENTALYEQLNQEAAELLAQGKSVIFDTNFKHYADRQKLRQIAAEQGAETTLLWVQTDPDLAKSRATRDAHRQHTRKLGDMTEADFERLSDHFEEPRPDETTIILDGTKITPDYLSSVLFKN